MADNKPSKGAGYARWASVFNLKQMAQTMNYLTEHGLLDYADLAAKAAERMAEIAVLKTHIINYAKTREVYVATARPVIPSSSRQSMRVKYCCIRRPRKPLMS